MISSLESAAALLHRQHRGGEFGREKIEEEHPRALLETLTSSESSALKEQLNAQHLRTAGCRMNDGKG